MNTAMTFPDTVDEFMEQYKMTDTECVYSNGTEYVPIYRMKQWFEHLKVKPKTNADCIRSMTDEELARFIHFAICPHEQCPELNVGVRTEHCIKCWLDWLRKESKT